MAVSLAPAPAISAPAVPTLDEVEASITRGYNDIGKGLAQIKTLRLYADRYPSFDVYCRERWGMGPRHAYRLIDAARIHAACINAGIEPPANEGQARELARLGDAAAVEVLRIARTEPGAGLTAAHIAD